MPNLTTAADFLAQARQRIDRLDARLLLESVCGLSHADLISRPETPLDSAAHATLLQWLERRASGEPLAYILGYAEFRGRRFTVSPAVLIPRPETEELVTLAVEKLAAFNAPRCVDLGTGSGIIAISIQLECPAAGVVAVELSPTALAVARRNAEALGATIDFRAGDWFVPLAGECFDLIVANPPYVVAGDPHLALNGLPYEPLGALSDGVVGGDGLNCIRQIIAQAGKHVTERGWLLVEHGYDQGAACRNLLRHAGFEDVFTRTDLSGIDRISGGRKP